MAEFGPNLRNVARIFNLSPEETATLAERYDDRALSGPSTFALETESIMANPSVIKKLGATRYAELQAFVAQILRDGKVILLDEGIDALHQYLDRHPLSRAGSDLPKSQDRPPEPPEIVRKAFRAGVLGQRFVDSLGYEDVVVLNDTDGPCERFMQSLSFIDGLREARSAYDTGRALLCIGSRMDGMGLDTSIAASFLHHLGIAIKRFNSTSETEQWSAEQTIDLFGSILSVDGTPLYQFDIGRWNELRESLLERARGPKVIMDDCAYMHPSLVEICNDIVPQTRSYHISADQYLHLEGATWSEPTWSLFPKNTRFVIHVDGDRWEKAIGTDKWRVRTDFLFANFGESDALFVERTSWEGPHFEGPKGRALGVDFDRTRRSLEWRTAENFVVNERRVRINPPDIEKGRIYHVALGFAILLQGPSINVKPIEGNELLSGHFTIELPDNATIDDAILSIVRAHGGW